MNTDSTELYPCALLFSCLQTLTEEHQEHTPKFDFLVQASPKHCTGDSQEVKSVRDQYTKLEKSWRTITNAMSEFPAMVGPWRELTGLYDKLCNSYQRVQDLVDRALAIVDERDGGHVSDIIHCLKVSKQCYSCILTEAAIHGSNSTLTCWFGSCTSMNC